MITDDAPDSVAVDLRPADVYIPPDVDAIVRNVQPRALMLIFDVTLIRRVPVANAVRVVADSGSGVVRHHLTRIVPDSVAVTGPRRAVNAIASVRTVEQTVTVGDSGEFVIPLDVKRLAAGVKVQPTEVKLLVHVPLARVARDSSRVTALKPR